MKIQMKIPYFIGAFVFVVLIVAGTYSFLHYQNNHKLKEGYINANVYFYDIASKKLKPDVRQIKVGTKEEMAGELLGYLWDGPKIGDYSRVVPENLNILSLKIDHENRTFIANFSDDYKELSPQEEIIFRSALVWTLTEFDFITYVDIAVGNQWLTDVYGDPILNMNRKNVLVDNAIDPGINVNETLILYFPDFTTKQLIETKQVVKVNQRELKSKFVVMELLFGPRNNGDLSKPFADGVTLRKISVQDTICYVDLSADFMNSISTDPQVEQLQIYAIVNSIIKNSDTERINKVQFLMESKKIQKEDYKGTLDLSKPLEFDSTLVGDNM